MEKTPLQPPRIDVALAAIFHPLTRQILICRRLSAAVLGDYWELPGGKCLPDETPAACAIRETLEEVSLTIEVCQPLPPIDHDYPHAHVRLHPFICRHLAGDPRPLAVAEVKWIPPTDLPLYPFPPANHDLMVLLAQGWDKLIT